jgi:hypothetical protein
VYDLLPLWAQNLLDPNNPFIPWLLLFNLVFLLLHIYIVYWVYRDALARYNRGAPWALFTALLPLGGWLFYLGYRRSPLVEFDRIEAELFDEDEHEWTDFDSYKQNQGAEMFKEIGAIFKRGEGGGYSAFIRASRDRELRPRLSPQERKDVRRLRQQRQLDARKARADKLLRLRQERRERARQRRERQTVVGPHGQSQRLSDRRQRALRKQLEVMEQLKTLPREDAALEQLIYEMRYTEALQQAQGNLAVAREMDDPQGIVTFEVYVERLQRLLAEA